jgi:hypothetical protein
MERKERPSHQDIEGGSRPPSGDRAIADSSSSAAGSTKGSRSSTIVKVVAKRGRSTGCSCRAFKLSMPPASNSSRQASSDGLRHAAHGSAHRALGRAAAEVTASAFSRAIQRVSLDPFSATTDRPVPADYLLRGPSSCPRIRCPRKSSAVDWRKRLKVDMGWRLEVVDRSSQP